MNKKSQSEVITAVLLILLVIVAVFIVWTAVKGVINRSTENLGIKSELIGADTTVVSVDLDSKTVKIRRESGGSATEVVPIILVNGAIVEADCNPNKIAQFETAECAVSSALAEGDNVSAGLKMGKSTYGAFSSEVSVGSSGTTPAQCTGNPMTFCNTYDGYGTSSESACSTADCSFYEKWCDGADVNQDGIVDFVDGGAISSASSFPGDWPGGIGCNYSEWVTYEYQNDGGYTTDWCGGEEGFSGADLNQDGVVDGEDNAIFESHSGYSECGTTNLYIDCYSTASCPTTEVLCETVPGCSWG